VPYSYAIDITARLATVTLAETVRGADIASALETVFRDSSWQPGFDLLWQASGITELLFERDDLPGMIALQRRFAARAGGGREVILVSRSLDEDMAKMYALMLRNEGKKVSVCRSMADAVRLLGPTAPTPVVE
jgi:hypothetical protein